ncbi:hypothetical protein D9M69_680790 [compost metagenome]
MVAISMRSTSDNMGLTVFISATTRGSAPLATKHSSSSVRVANSLGSKTMGWRCSSTMRTRRRRASGCPVPTTSTISSLYSGSNTSPLKAAGR